MPFVKFSVTETEMSQIRQWADGVPIGPLVKRLVMQNARVPVRYLPGTSQVPQTAGTDLALKNKKRKSNTTKSSQPTLGGLDRPPVAEPHVQKIVSHLNETCCLRALPSDPKIREAINGHLAAGYTVADFEAVHVWANTHWPPGRDRAGKDWRSIMLVPSKLYGAAFGDYVASATGTTGTEELVDGYTKARWMEGCDNA